MKIKRNLGIIIFVIMAAAFVAASNVKTNYSIVGKVVDKSNNERIIFATIMLYKGNSLVKSTESDFDGNYMFSQLDEGNYSIKVNYLGYLDEEIKNIVLDSDHKSFALDIELRQDLTSIDEVVVIDHKIPLMETDNAVKGSTTNPSMEGNRNNEIVYFIDGIRTFGSIPTASNQSRPPVYVKKQSHIDPYIVHSNTTTYAEINENQFTKAAQEGYSTFALDVDRAAYSNVRRYINNGATPPADAVRIEEMINYFDYNYEQPTDTDEPFAIHQTLTDCPWNEGHQLLHIGIQGRRIQTDRLPPSNLVFLVDVSGSMASYNKLPLLQTSLKMLVKVLRPEDKVAIVTYAGRASLALPLTSATDKQKIISAIESLSAGGSTAGAEGIITAYQIAVDNFIEKGNNRVILATDGDFNVGASSDEAMQELIEEKRKTGVFLSVLGFGMGNYKDSKMQVLANKGNGNHAYIDNIKEARKTLVTEFGGTLHTIAKDVKIQVEFNPAYVSEYKLVGYENRMLEKEDFNNDQKDGGELGSGHTMTAIYEIVPVGVKSAISGNVDDYKYKTDLQKEQSTGKKNKELANIKLRWKKPDGQKSSKVEQVVGVQTNELDNANESVKFAVAVAEFGLVLRNSKLAMNASIDHVVSLAETSRSNDKEGNKIEFINLVKSYQQMEAE